MNKKQFNKLVKKIATNKFCNKKLDLSRESWYDNPDCDRETPRLTDVEVIKLASALKQNLYITQLDLSFNEIGDEGAKTLARVLTLEEINFTGNKITVVGAEALGKSLLIKKLSLAGNPIYYKGSDHIKFQNMIDSFCNNTTITDLNLSFSIIPDKMIAKLINKNTTIRIFTVSRDLTDEALEFIGNNITLKELYIYKNVLTELGAYYLSKNSSLHTLYISNSKIDDTGAKYLSNHQSLQKLSLLDSNITMKGANYFCISNIEEVTLFNGIKHDFISYTELQQFKVNFQYSKAYKQNLANELFKEEPIELYKSDEDISCLIGENQDEG